MRKLFSATLFTTALLCAQAHASALYKPFVSASPAGSSVTEATAAVKQKLQAAGFEVVGDYSPYADNSALILGVTNADLKTAAATHTTGGFGAVLRVSITNNNGVIEVSYTNPTYQGLAYRIGELSSADAALGKALGAGEAFGAEGLSAESLKKYHYMAFMPYFDDAEKLATFGSHAEAVSALEAAMQKPEADMKPVWKVPVGATQTIIGVNLNGGDWKGQMKNIMAKIDIHTPKSTAALPWEFLVSGNDVYYLPGKYRIALMFPDLSMGAFMKISDVPTLMDSSAAELVKLAKP